MRLLLDFVLQRDREGGDGVELGEAFLADALEVADDAEEAVAHARELGLALLEHARHGHFFRLQVLAHGGEAVDHGLHPLGELRAADVVVDELHFLGAAEVGLARLVELEEHRAQRLGERPGGIEAHDPDGGRAHEGLTRVARHRGGDDHRQLGADRLLVVFELPEPRRLPGLGLLRLPDDGAAAVARGRVHVLQEVGAVHALGDGHDLVEREGVAQQRFERELERFALELLRALLELAPEVGGFALRGFDLGLELRLDAPALFVEAPLVVDVAVLVRLLQLAHLAPELQLLAAEPSERAFLGAQRLVQGLALRVELRLRLGGELGLELPAVRGDAALEVLGVALDGLARDALGKREAVIALGAGDLLPAVDDDGARHGSSEKSGSEPETRKKRKSGSDPMVREVVAHSVSLPGDYLRTRWQWLTTERFVAYWRSHDPQRSGTCRHAGARSEVRAPARGPPQERTAGGMARAQLRLPAGDRAHAARHSRLSRPGSPGREAHHGSLIQ